MTCVLLEGLENLKKLRVGRFSDEKITAEFEGIRAIVEHELVEKSWKELFRGTNTQCTWM